MSDSREVPMTAVVTDGTSDPTGLDRDPFIAIPSDVDTNPETNNGNPALGVTEAEKLAGDEEDDDYAYLEDIVSAGRDPYAILLENDVDSAMDVPKTPDPRPEVTRAIPTTVPLALNYAPVMILPPDPDRKRFVLWATGDFKWASEANLCAMAGDWPGASVVLDLPCHTGAVWVAPASTASSSTVTVSGISITGGK